MISCEQIRAARAMLDWSTNNLAALTGLTANGINKIERGLVTPLESSLKKIKAAFEYFGVEFMSGAGLRKKDLYVMTFTGKDAGRKIAVDIYETLKDSGGILRIAHANEKNAVDFMGEDYLLEQIRKRKEAKIVHRSLYFERNFYPLQGLPPETYRPLPDAYFFSCPFFIYGTKLAIYTTDTVERSTVIDDARLADSVTRVFDFVWELAGGAYPKETIF